MKLMMLSTFLFQEMWHTRKFRCNGIRCKLLSGSNWLFLNFKANIRFYVQFNIQLCKTVTSKLQHTIDWKQVPFHMMCKATMKNSNLPSNQPIKLLHFYQPISSVPKQNYSVSTSIVYVHSTIKETQTSLIQ